MKKIILPIILFLSVGCSYAQSHGYWSNHVGIDAGASFLHFNQPQLILPVGSTSVPALTGSLFFDFIRMHETASRDIPVWGIKLKFNLQAVGYKGPNGSIYYADAFTIPLLLKVALIHSEGYYDIHYDRATNQYVPGFHNRKKFALFLFGGPQYDYIYGKNNYPDAFSNKAMVNKLFYGNLSAKTGLEFNFENFLFEAGWQQDMQPVYYNGNPVKSSGLVLLFGLTFNNVYRHYH